MVDSLSKPQFQRQLATSFKNHERVKYAFVVENKVMKHAKANMIVNPLPRNSEIHEEIDYESRATYFRQVRAISWVEM